MKKLLSLIVVLVFTTFLSIHVMAESINLTTLDNDALLELEAEIKAEKAIRGLPASAVLIQGKYRVGADGDIPAGRYTVVFEYSNQESAIGDYYYIHFEVFDSEGERILRKELTNKNTPHPSCSIELPEGSLLDIGCDAAIRLVKSEGIVFE